MPPGGMCNGGGTAPAWSRTTDRMRDDPMKRPYYLLSSLLAWPAASGLMLPLPPALGTPVGHQAQAETCKGVAATIVGTESADTILGTGHRDVIVASGGPDVVLARGGRDLVCAGTGDDRVAGAHGDDRLLGGGGTDRTSPGEGSDRVFGGGGKGRDTISYLGSSVPVRLNLRRERAYTGSVVDHVMGFEYAVGSHHDDTLIGRGDLGSLDGADGDDLVIGGDHRDTLAGGNGHDVIRGGDGRDRLFGESGDDVLRGQVGNDQLFGGGGADDVIDLVGSNFVNVRGRSRVRTGAGRDSIVGHGVVTLRTGAGNDEVSFQKGSVVAGAGADVVNFNGFHRAGSTDIVLGAGQDTLGFGIAAGPIADGIVLNVSGGKGTDLLNAGYLIASTLTLSLGTNGALTDPFHGQMIGVENVIVGSYVGSANVIGSKASNTIRASSSSDHIEGRRGDDDIDTGGDGDDNIDGGAGTDRCVGAPAIIRCEILS